MPDPTPADDHERTQGPTGAATSTIADDVDEPRTAAAPDRWRRRALLGARCVAAGACLALSVPPWGWWPLGFVGAALWVHLLADQPALARFRRSWLVVAAWLFPAMVWMWDLTPPGYVIAASAYAGYFGVAMALVPPGRWRWLGFPGAIVVAELARWSFPFGGVPLASLAIGQADGPVAVAARVGNAIAVSGLVAIGGVALAAAWERRWRPAAVSAALVVAVVLAGHLAPDGEPVGTFDVAIVQGGGPQRTRAADTDEREVFERHLRQSAAIAGDVDLVLWPENVVSVEGELVDNEEQGELELLSATAGAPVIAGTTEGISDEAFLNASVVVTPEGTVDRYDKVLRVPFGEYVPLRPVVEAVAGGAGLPRRDAVPGPGPAVVDVPLPDGEVVPMGIVISWEVFFTSRARDAVRNGGEVLLNPTNGSSYWLTQVQTQQVASSRLRALETGRWVLQAAPTGFSAVVSPDGEVIERSRISDPALLEHVVERRTGLTWATRLGQGPVLGLAALALAAAWLLTRRDDADGDVPSGDPAVVPAPDPTGS